MRKSPEQEPQTSLPEFQWINSAVLATNVFINKGSTPFFASREALQQLYNPARVAAQITAAHQKDLYWSKMPDETTQAVTTWLSAAQETLEAHYDQLTTYFSHLSQPEERQLLCFLTLMYTPQELGLERIIDRATAHMVLRQVVTTFRNESYIRSMPDYMMHFLICDMSGNKQSIDGNDQWYYKRTLQSFLDDVRQKLQGILGKPTRRDTYHTYTSFYSGAVPSHRGKRFLETLEQESFVTPGLSQWLTTPNQFEVTLQAFLAPLITEQERVRAPQLTLPTHLTITSLQGDGIHIIVPCALEQKDQSALKLSRQGSQRAALEHIRVAAQEAPPRVEVITTSTGEQYGLLVFAPVYSVGLLRLLHAVAPSTGTSYGNLADIPTFTKADWVDEKTEILELHDQIPGWSEFQHEKRDWLTALNDAQSAYSKSISVEYSLFQLISYLAACHTPANTVTYTHAQTYGEGLERKAFTAHLAQVAGSTILEKLITVLHQPPITPGVHWAQIECVETQDGLEVKAYYTEPQDVPTILLRAADAAHNRIQVRFPDGSDGSYQLTPELEFSGDRLKNLKPHPLTTTETSERCITPLLCWKLGSSQPAPLFKEAILPANPRFADTALPSEVLSRIQEKYGDHWSILMGGLAAAALHPGILSEWAAHPSLGAKGKEQKMGEPQVPLFSAWFRGHFSPLLSAVENGLRL